MAEIDCARPRHARDQRRDQAGHRGRRTRHRGDRIPAPGTIWAWPFSRPYACRFEGSVGYYCGGLIDGPHYRNRRQRRLGTGGIDAERQRSSCTAARAMARQRPSAAEPWSFTATRRRVLGVSMKGGTVLVAGNCGYMAAFMGQKGTLDCLRRRRRRIRRFHVRYGLFRRRTASRGLGNRRSGRGTDRKRTSACLDATLAQHLARSCKTKPRRRISRRSWPAASSGISISANGKSGRRLSEIGRRGDQYGCAVGRPRGERDLLQSSGTFQPAVIEDIQAKAASGLYRIRGLGHAARAALGHVRRSDVSARAR